MEVAALRVNTYPDLLRQLDRRRRELGLRMEDVDHKSGWSGAIAPSCSWAYVVSGRCRCLPSWARSTPISSSFLVARPLRRSRRAS
jgi:hypothetical protein